MDLLQSHRFGNITVHSTFPPAVARLHFTVWFPKAPRRGGLFLEHMIITYLPQTAEIFGAICLLAGRMTGIYHFTQWSGIYAIRCDVDFRVYIGKSYSLRHRIKTHSWHLRRGSHDNHRLQAAWNIHGESNFSEWIIAECEQSRLPELEYFYLNLTKSEDPQYGFNVDGVHPLTGKRVLSAATREKIGMSNRGNVLSAVTREKIGRANFGKRHQPRTPEQREKYRRAVLGRKATPETRAKQSTARKGRIITPEWRRNLSLATKGIPKSPETRLRMKAAQAQRKAERLAQKLGLAQCL